MEKLLNPLQNKESETENKEYYFNSKTRTYIRNISDNINRFVDTLDTYKEICVSLENLFSSAQDQKMNQIMYSLTIVSTIFL